MIKNMTRKGLAIGAAAAMAVTGFTLPAQSAGLADTSFVSLSPNQGTEYSVLLDNFFDLKANAASSVSAAGNLKFLVEDIDSSTKFDIDVDGTLNPATQAALTQDSDATKAGSVVTFTVGAHGLVTGDVIEVTTAATAGVPAGSYSITKTTNDEFTITADATALSITQPPVIKGVDSGNLDSRANIAAGKLGAANLAGASRVQTPAGWDGTDGRKSATDGTYVINSGVNNSTNDKVVRLVSTSATTHSVNVTAWVDANNNGLIDSTEYASPTRTVTFTKVSDATFTTTLTAPALAATSVEAFVNLGDAFNHSMIGNTDQANLLSVRFQFNAGSDQSSNVAYNAATTLLRATNATAPFNDVAAGVYNAQARYDSTSVGAAAFQTTVAGTVDIVDTLGALDADNTADYNGTNLRTGAKALSLSTQVLEGTAPDVKARAGIPAKVTITKNTLSSTSVITAGGKTLATSGTSITFDSATNADGEVVVDIASSTGAKNDSITVQVEVLDTTTWRSVSKTLVWADAALAGASAVIHLDSIGSDVHNVAKGGTIALNYMVRDTFGQPFTAAGYRLSFSTDGAVTGGASVAGTAAVTNGLATFNLTDSTVSATGNYTVRATLEKINLAGNGYDTQAGHTSDVVVHVGVPAIASVTQTTAAMLGTTTETDRIVLQTVDMVSGDGRKINITFPYTDNKYTVTGTVRGASGAPVPGAAVTISAPGAGITTGTTGAELIHGVGSLTVYANANGAYTVYVYSNKSGKVDVSVTAGSASATGVAYFKKPATTAGKTLVIDAPASVAQGSTLTVKATLTDKYGNGVEADNGAGTGDLKITYSGPGLLVNTPTAFVNGALQFGVLLGANDSGTASVTIEVYTGTANLTTQKTIVLGDVVPGAGTVRGWTKFLDATDELKIYARDLVGQGKVQFMVNGNELAWIRATSAADSKINVATDGMVRSVFVSDMLVGRNVIEIYVDGVRIDRRIFTR